MTLPKGEYKLTFLAQYVCQNEMRHVNGYTVSTTGDNINYSRCGVCFGDTAIYKYPRQANHWKTVECPFELDKETDVTISLGLETTHGVGAAYNTRIYIDQVRLYSKRESSIDPAPAPDDPVGIAGIENVDEKNVDVYNLQGIKLRCNVPTTDATTELPQGIYIVGQKKVIRH